MRNRGSQRRQQSPRHRAISPPVPAPRWPALRGEGNRTLRGLDGIALGVAAGPPSAPRPIQHVLTIWGAKVPVSDGPGCRGRGAAQCDIDATVPGVREGTRPPSLTAGCLPRKARGPYGPGGRAQGRAGRAVAGAGSPPVHVAGRPACEHGHYFGPCGPSPRPRHTRLVPGAAATWRQRCQRDFPLLPVPFRSRRADRPGSLPCGGAGPPPFSPPASCSTRMPTCPGGPPAPTLQGTQPTLCGFLWSGGPMTVPKGQLKLGPYTRPPSRRAARS